MTILLLPVKGVWGQVTGLSDVGIILGGRSSCGEGRGEKGEFEWAILQIPTVQGREKRGSEQERRGTRGSFEMEGHSTFSPGVVGPTHRVERGDLQRVYKVQRRRWRREKQLQASRG